MTNRPNLTEEEKEHYNKVAMDMFHNKTPRTDKAEPQIRFIKSGWVRSDFAKELELELNALKKKLDDSFVKSSSIPQYKIMPPITWHAEIGRNAQDTAFTQD
jgi:hypothetical protein